MNRIKNSHNQSVPSTDPSSFRDPSGFVFWEKGQLYRQINQVYRENFEFFIQSGLYRCLIDKGLIVPHRNTHHPLITPDGYKIIKPQIIIPFMSYPYEWSFSQLKIAALTTLKIHQLALNYNMVLKDASAYNIQFFQGKPIHIDKLSFERYVDGRSWVAYRQFCQHFLAPLALMVYTDIRLGKLLRLYLDGIPLDLAARLLPKKSLLNLGIFTHLHLHAMSQSKYANKSDALKSNQSTLSKTAMLGLIDNLITTINKLSWRFSPNTSEWGDYYNFTNYDDKGFKHKQLLVSGWLKEINPKIVWDLGANDGRFSRLASKKGINTLAFDIDPVAVEINYLHSVHHQDLHMLPLLLDLTNPSPSIGWGHNERYSLVDRGPADLVLALALIHHLRISNNIPLTKIAGFFASIAKNLIIEFVPKEDSKIQRLLATRADIFTQYDLSHFLSAFKLHFKLLNQVKILHSNRTIFLYKHL